MATYRLDEAQLMYSNGYFQGAYYLGGYAVEFCLKSLICRKLGVEVFSLQKGPNAEANPTVVKSLQIHELQSLLVFAGLFPLIRDSRVKDGGLFKAWNKVSAWTIERRYEPLKCSPQTVKDFLTSVSYIMSWVRSHY